LELIRTSAVTKTFGQFKSFDGTSLYYELRGSGQGEPIIFIYGIACLINHFRPQVNYFSNFYRTVVYDLRGHQKSQKGPVENLTISSLSKDLLSMMDYLKIKKAHLIGHSFGVPILIDFAAANPERVSSLVLINGFSKNPIKNMFGLNIVEPFFHFLKKKYSEAPSIWNYIWQQSINNPLAIQLSALAGGFNLKLTSLKDIEIYVKGVAHMDLEVFLTLFEDMMNFDGDQLLPKINAPTLVISGEKDMVTPESFQKEMALKIPHGIFMRVPYGSHCTQFDFPDYINLTIEKFYSSLEEEVLEETSPSI
jgi:pimeloyl-ACP methyl ester carboxylesterase